MNAQVRIFDSAAEASMELAQELAALIRERAKAGAPLLLGLATGATPVETYADLVQMHAADPFDTNRLQTVNLDEFEGLPAGGAGSFRAYMQLHLFEPLGLDLSRTHFPPAWSPAEQSKENCAALERHIRELGGIDLQLLGIGANGHIGYNEPGSGRESRTRRVQLDSSTRGALGAKFAPEEAPEYAWTLGVATVLEARSVRLLAFGESKAAIVRDAIEGGVSPEVPASFLQEHPGACFYLDPSAAALLGE